MILEMKDICKDYPMGKSTVQVLKNINLEVEEGQYLTIMGPSGSGKTTLMNILGALDRPTEGSVIFDGNELFKMDDKARGQFRRQNVGFVFQSVALIPMMTAYENVEFALRLAGVVIGAIAYYVVIALVIQLGLNTDDLKLFSAAFIRSSKASVPIFLMNSSGSLASGTRNTRTSSPTSPSSCMAASNSSSTC